MSFSALRPEVQVRLAVIAPLIGLFLTIFVVYPAWQRHAEMRAIIDKQEKELADMRAAPLPPPVAEGVVIVAEPSEPPRFLGQLREIAISANCRIVGFDLVPGTNTPAPAPTATETTPGQEPPKDTTIVKATRARIELDATYPQVREFLYRLSCSQRPLTVTNVALSTPNTNAKTAGTVHAAIDIERYVVPPAG